MVEIKEKLGPEAKMSEWVSMGCIALEFRTDDLNALSSPEHMNPVSFR